MVRYKINMLKKKFFNNIYLDYIVGRKIYI